MSRYHDLKNSIFKIRTAPQFNQVALNVFYRQAAQNVVYKTYLKYLGVSAKQVSHVDEIPFLPIQFFKRFDIKTGNWQPQHIFTSSTTTGSTPSRHLAKHTSFYTQSFLAGFRHFYGAPKDYTILALLPAYLERSGSSLVYMADELIARSRKKNSAFYLHNYHELVDVLEDLATQNQPTLLLGVSFALLDVAALIDGNLQHPNLVVMETGGMKGRRKELVKSELHQLLQKGFGVRTIHSEYGMTELFSQAYSSGRGIYTTPPWMQVYARQTTDPLAKAGFGKTGGLNIIDLANIDTCAFIATDDLGRTHPNGTFEVLGRFDQADIRGCNLMVF